MATTATRLRDRRRLDDCGWADTDQHDRELGEEVHLVHGSPQQGPGQGVRHGFRRRLPEYPVSATAEALSLPPESDTAASVPKLQRRSTRVRPVPVPRATGRAADHASRFPAGSRVRSSVSEPPDPPTGSNPSAR